MSEWISVDEKLPEHMQKVQVKVETDPSESIIVLTYIDREKMYEKLRRHGITPHAVVNEGLIFSDPERPGLMLNNVTHWKPFRDN